MIGVTPQILCCEFEQGRFRIRKTSGSDWVQCGDRRSGLAAMVNGVGTYATG